MIVVIIAGGAGTRLWPLSTPKHPKHLLSLTGDERSLLQSTYERARLLGTDVYIIPEKSQVEEIHRQLPTIPKEHIIAEPGRRGTASCVVMALARIQKHHSPDEPIVFMHADHYIRDWEAFRDTVQVAGELSVINQQMVLLGLEPRYPSTGFGYIERGERVVGGPRGYKVASFKEKPDRATAEQYLNSGRYLWNMGYFIAPLQVFERSLREYAPHLWANYEKLKSASSAEEHDAHYLGFENEAIDIALNEKVKDLMVSPGTFDWMDVGSYPDVHKVNSQDENGNVLQGKCEVELLTNSYVRNDTETPLVVIGLDNVAVVLTEDGVLVVSKTQDQKVGDVAKRIQG